VLDRAEDRVPVVIAHFDAADFAVPPLVITPEREEASNG